MAYFKTPLGNGVIGGNGNVVKDVRTSFGQIDTGNSVGVVKVEGPHEYLTFEFTGSGFADLGASLVDTYIPAGAILKDATATVEEVFALTGTTPVVNFGTATTEGTNGFTASKAQLEAVGSYSLLSTLKGTWAVNTPLAARTKLGVALGGTTPGLGRGGRARVTISYARTARGI